LNSTIQPEHFWPACGAVDVPEHSRANDAGRLRTATAKCVPRMGRYKPRTGTNPYSFQGHGKGCLAWCLKKPASTAIKGGGPWEITHESHIEENSILPGKSWGA